MCLTWLVKVRDVTHSYASRDSFICVVRRLHMWDVTLSCVWRNSLICVPWLIRMCGKTPSYVWRDAFICVTWRDAFKSLAGSCASTPNTTWLAHTSCVPWLIHFIRMCAVTHSLYSYVCHDSFTLFVCVTWLMHILHMCDATHSHNSCVTRLVHSTHALLLILDLCAVTHSYYPYVRRDSFIWFIQATRLIHIIHTCVYVCDTTHLTCDMCQVNFPYVWRAIFIHATRFIHMCGVLYLRVTRPIDIWVNCPPGMTWFL